jgi:serine/threonine-protein kinase
MGIVYRAEDEKLRRTVALKVLPEAFAADEERRKRFLREAQSAGALTHANIATVYEVDEDAGHVFIAMELVEGPTLRERMARGRLSVSEVVRIARGIARGLARAHAKGIVHRDLKPDNVMLDVDGEPKILDFGLAKLREDGGGLAASVAEQGETASVLTKEGHLLGTPHYMSPEQAGSGAGVDTRSDVFSLGVLLYEMCAGRRPFEADRLGELLARIERDPPAPLRSLAPELPEALVAVIDRCLAKKPSDRYPDAGAVATALESIPVYADASQPKAGLSARSLAGSEVTHPGARRARSRWPIALGGVALLLVAGATWRARSPSVSASPVASASAAASDAAVHGVAFTDHPPPATSVPEAAAVYASALKHLRDAEGATAADEFARACKLDPAMAAADVRTAIYHRHYGDNVTVRDCYAAAVEHRASLDERDRVLLRVAETWVADPPLPDDEGWARIRGLAERFPQDAEAQYILAAALIEGGDLPGARAALHRVLELDPQCALAVFQLSNVAESPEQGSQFVNRCLEMNPAASSCLLARGLGNMSAGKCDDFEADARRLIVAQPSGPRSYELYAAALAARNAPVEAVRDTLARRVPLERDDRLRRLAQVQNDLWIATLAGDLDAAEKACIAWDQVHSGSLAAEDRFGPYLQRFELLEEEGDLRRALDVADEAERRGAGWTGTVWALPVAVATVRNRAGRIDDAEFRRVLDRSLRGDPRPYAWAFNLERSQTREQATAALALWPDANVPEMLTPIEDAAFLGHALFLAGRTQDALPHLQAITTSCSAMPTTETIRAYTVLWMRAHVELGQALEQTGDTAGACAAYAPVLDRWKNAKPRSVSLEKAKERSKALGCPK